MLPSVVAMGVLLNSNIMHNYVLHLALRLVHVDIHPYFILIFDLICCKLNKIRLMFFLIIL